ncbi:MAG: sigma-70 family RNA polymerase sigma factor [Planctomycetes bacterium]|nr:sigma-70 family RNA polymerase sigma factor [Planctomycetota bacterium]
MSAATSGDARFLTTRWSVVLDAGNVASPRRAAALEDLATAYWFPLYAYARRKGLARDAAADLVQAHFARILEREDLATVDRERGRFRAWLRAGLDHLLANQREAERAQKRGGNAIHVPIDAPGAESRLALDLPDPRPPERTFEREWALTLLGRARERLAAEQAHAGKAAVFEALLPALAGDDDAPPHAAVALRLGISENAAKVALHRLRRRLGELVRDEVAGTLGPGEDVEGELRELLAALGTG